MQPQDPALRRRARLVTTRQRGTALLLLAVLFVLVGAARSGRYDTAIGHLSRQLEARVEQATAFVRRHLGG